MGWMHDTLTFMGEDPLHRKYHLDQLTFSFTYAFSEHYCLPLSHDEVVHGKGSLWGKMAGDDWQKAANVRLLFGHMFGHPGKKLLFMGSEFGQMREWNHDGEIDWELLDYPRHAALQAWIIALNELYRAQSALWNDTPSGYAWIDGNKDESTLAYQRMSEDETLLIVLNFTPMPRDGYRLGVPEEGTYEILLNSDDPAYGGSGYTDAGTLESTPTPHHGRDASLEFALPPLGVVVLKIASHAA
jgi:1,4-alpha-glucan branching enzyme